VSLRPTAPAERDPAIDVLRGVALLGVLLENAQHFVSPSYVAIATAPGAALADRLALGGLRLLCDNKVYLLFALLFGYGIALQMQRAAEARERFAALHLWRMAILLLIGIAHSLVWTGDILASYAVLGALLLPMRNLRTSALHALAALFLAIPAGIVGGALVAAEGASAQVRSGIEIWLADSLYPARQSCFAFAAFAVGLSAGRRRALSDRALLGALARRTVPLALAVGLVGNLAWAALQASGRSVLSLASLASEATIAVAAPALACAVAILVLRACERPQRLARLLPLADTGRATLSNYLLQTAIGVGVLARLGPVHPPAGILASGAIFALQVGASRAWLARFRFGPAEWLWRSLSYGRALPLR
jgi:uncharacterized protein